MIPRECKISDEQVGDLVIWDVKGDLARRSEPAFEEAYARLSASNATKILLQFEPHGYFNSEGIKVLFQLIAKTKRNQQLVAITGLSGHFKKIFESQLDDSDVGEAFKQTSAEEYQAARQAYRKTGGTKNTF